MKIKDNVLISIDDSDIDSDGRCVIPYGVIAIGKEVFTDSKVKSVMIPNSVTDICTGAFHRCRLLTEITIPDSVTNLGDYVFYDCNSLTDVKIGRGITCISEHTFCECSSLKNVMIPDTITEIKVEAFIDCCSLNSITLPNSVTAIESGVFDGCVSLSKVIIGGKLKYMGDGVFYDCPNLKEIIVASEDTKQLVLAKNASTPPWCKIECEIIVDTSLNKADNISLGLEYLSDAAKDTINYSEELDNIEINEGDVL